MGEKIGSGWSSGKSCYSAVAPKCCNLSRSPARLVVLHMPLRHIAHLLLSSPPTLSIKSPLVPILRHKPIHDIRIDPRRKRPIRPSIDFVVDKQPYSGRESEHDHYDDGEVGFEVDGLEGFSIFLRVGFVSRGVLLGSGAWDVFALARSGRHGGGCGGRLVVG